MTPLESTPTPIIPTLITRRTLVDRPPVELQLVGEGGNAFAIMGRFQQAARRAGWTRKEIETVLTSAKSGDYDNFLCVIMDHSYEPTSDNDDETYDESTAPR